jgi:hypothetical protein
LFLEENEIKAQAEQQAAMAERNAIPGMLKPSEIDNDL